MSLPPKPTQLELPLSRIREPDRNRDKGGRSFYFFDFDDNVAFLTTPMFLFHRTEKTEIQISSKQFAEQSQFIGKEGPFADYEIDYNPAGGSFRCFRDKDLTLLERQEGRRQMFVEDLAAALGLPDLHWKGPSWSCFYHAVFNARPTALITARGHHPDTLKSGIRVWVEEGFLPFEPNYLALYPVSHPLIQQELKAAPDTSIPRLKQLAIRRAVEEAFKQYGFSPHHRFGMSDDDPRNIEWIIEEMRQLKREYPTISFFVIQTHGEQMIKHEVFADYVIDRCLPHVTNQLQHESQLTLFEE